MERYETSDLALASYLYGKGYVLEGVRDGEYNPAQKVFTFERKQKVRIEDEAQVYLDGKALVEPRRYFDDIRQMKNRVWAAKSV